MQKFENIESNIESFDCSLYMFCKVEVGVTEMETESKQKAKKRKDFLSFIFAFLL